jgi:hypothetical protein
MKRFVLALPVLAATVLFCLTAFAGDAATAGILPEPVQAHWLVAIMAVIVPALRTGLSNDTVKLPTAAAKWRMVMIGILAAATTFFDGLMNGFALNTALLAFLVSGLPSIVQEILKVVFGSSQNPPAAGTGSSRTAMFPPVAMLMVALSLALGGCSWFKSNGCQLIRTTADICDTVVIILPDGSEERVPKDAIVGMAMSARATRVSGAMKASVPDAGADR